MKKEYIVSKDQCQRNIDGICPQCGGQIEPIETEDNAGNPTFWAGCKKCGIFSRGVSDKTFAIATEMVRENNFISYYTMRQPDVFEEDKNYEDYYYKCLIRGACSIVDQILDLAKEFDKFQNK